MKTKFLSVVIAVSTLIFGSASCKKDGTGNNQHPPVEKIKTEKGSPAGNAISKTIGASGGSLTSADGKITVSVPAGAVSANTVFSIQPITTTLTGNESRPTFRLLPEGVNFIKKINLTFHYDEKELLGSRDDLLSVCYQTEDGYWKAVPSSLNKANKTISVETEHFSDWTMYDLLSLEITKPILAVHEQTDILIKGYETDTDQLLNAYEGSGSFSQVTWTMANDSGMVASSAQEPLKARYQAPFPLKHGTNGVVQAEIKGRFSIPDNSASGGSRTFTQLLLIAQISLANETYMQGSFLGMTIDATDVQLVSTGGQMMINGSVSNDSSSVGYSLQVMANESGKYSCGNLLIPGNAEVAVSGQLKQQPINYTTHYIKCGPPTAPGYSTGKVVIDNWGPVGTYITGSFQGALYKLPDECSPPNKPLDLKFRAKRVL
ncbi:MAG: hypothetical protein DI535_16630 [Citrobacter freundii]|nr:MAG: hypothetical protein DI535_16630 [Citrobacter freundii]